MRKRLIAPLLLATILLTGGSHRGSLPAAGAKPGLIASFATPKPRAANPRRAATPWAAESLWLERSVAQRRAGSGAPLALSEDATALLAETGELRLLSEGRHLDLSAAQWSALAAVALNIQAIRQTYEAQIATRTVLAPGRYRLEIPMYAEMGDALRAKFLAELRTELGGATAAEIVEKLGSPLEGHFAGFGVAVQTLDITAAPGRAPADCEVTRTVIFWNSVDGRNRLSTRRETHFPGWEDPSGESWGPLLAIGGASPRPRLHLPPRPWPGTPPTGFGGKRQGGSPTPPNWRILRRGK